MFFKGSEQGLDSGQVEDVDPNNKLSVTYLHLQACLSQLGHLRWCMTLWRPYVFYWPIVLVEFS